MLVEVWEVKAQTVVSENPRIGELRYGSDLIRVRDSEFKEHGVFEKGREKHLAPINGSGFCLTITVNADLNSNSLGPGSLRMKENLCS